MWFSLANALSFDKPRVRPLCDPPSDVHFQSMAPSPEDCWLPGYNDGPKMGQRLSPEFHRRKWMPRASWRCPSAPDPRNGASGSNISANTSTAPIDPPFPPRCRRQRRRHPVFTTPEDRARMVPNVPSCTLPLAPLLHSPHQVLPHTQQCRLFQNLASSIHEEHVATVIHAAIRMDRHRLLRRLLRRLHRERQRNHRRSASVWDDLPLPLFQLAHLVLANSLLVDSAKRAKRVRSLTSGILNQHLQRFLASSLPPGCAQWVLFVCLIMSSPPRQRSPRHRILYGPPEVYVNPPTSHAIYSICIRSPRR